MIRRAMGQEWEGVQAATYKNEPGDWAGVSRRVLFEGNENAKFQVRSFRIEPGGRTSFERHAHEHCVVVLRGSGAVFLGEQEHAIGVSDVVRVASGTAHRFEARGDRPFEFLCIVDLDRDAPVSCPGPNDATGNAKGGGASY